MKEKRRREPEGIKKGEQKGERERKDEKRREKKKKHKNIAPYKKYIIVYNNIIGKSLIIKFFYTSKYFKLLHLTSSLPLFLFKLYVLNRLGFFV